LLWPSELNSMDVTVQRLKAYWKKYRPEILIFLAVFGVRFLYASAALFWFGSDSFVSFSDADTFVREAHNILEHGVMSQASAPPYLPDPLRTPLYLWFLALLLGSGFSLFGIVIIQNLLVGIIGVMVYRLGQILFVNARVGSVAGLLFALEPSSVYWNNLLMSDNLFAVLFILSVYLFFTRRWYWFSALFAFATLTRPIGLYLFPLFLLGTFLFSLSFKRIIIMSLVFFVIISPWMMRNKVLFGNFELSTAGWLNLYLFTVKEFSLRHNLPLPMPSIPVDYYPWDEKKVLYNYEFTAAHFFKERTLEVLRKYPVAYPVFHIVSGIRGIRNHDYQYLVDYVVAPLWTRFDRRLGMVFVLFGYGFWWLIYGGAFTLLFSKNYRRTVLFLLVLIVFNSLLVGYNGLISGGGRYTMPFLPLWFLLGAFGWSQVYQFFSKPYHKEV